MTSCFKTSNNKYSQCPARMADGRHFTDYRPTDFINDLIRADNNISNSLNYRVFLQQNANELMIDFKANPRRYVGFSIFGAKK